MSYRSPDAGYELRPLEGDPDKIETDAASFIALADDLDALSGELQAIGESGVHRSKGTDALAELATKAKPEVDKAEERYRGTAEVLQAYAPELRKAKRWIEDHQHSVEEAEERWRSAVEASEDARRDQGRLSSVMPWEDEPTDAQIAAAQGAVSSAEGAETAAKQIRDERWESFETVFSAWSDAYDDAVAGVDGAIEAAGNDDGFWEGLADFLDILGWVVTGLAIVALFVSGPIGAVIMALVVIGSLVLLAGKIAQYATGRTTWQDVALAGFALITLGAGGVIARVASKGAPTLSTAMGTTRAIARPAIRAGMRGPTLNPFTWHRPLTNRVGAWSQARAATPRPGILTGDAWSSIRFGGADTGRTLQFLQTARGNLGQYPAVVSSIDDMIVRATPSVASQVGQVSLWVSGTAADVGDKLGLIPKTDPLVRL
ncbi:hypothetical protein [Agrococcus sp. HG114]|uniref:hypothetical protein n=1 Tax=Agrococcus sp. HG114 TaxID=2969757 RepID=UPI00215A650F|nr:hypothetical protein [Agrococcus sp. HG114]MCR8670082.1 hypothetical protein [Agrococcus sp. HG114]